jgi:hypothetical protein
LVFLTEVKNNTGGYDVLIEVMHVSPLVARVVMVKKRPTWTQSSGVRSHFPNPDIYSLVEVSADPQVFKMVKKSTGKQIQITIGGSYEPDEFSTRVSCDCEDFVYRNKGAVGFDSYGCKHVRILRYIDQQLGVY